MSDRRTTWIHLKGERQADLAAAEADMGGLEDAA